MGPAGEDATAGISVKHAIEQYPDIVETSTPALRLNNPGTSPAGSIPELPSHSFREQSCSHGYRRRVQDSQLSYMTPEVRLVDTTLPTRWRILPEVETDGLNTELFSTV